MDSIIDKGERLLPAMFSGRMRRIRLATPDGELWGYAGAIGERADRGLAPAGWHVYALMALPVDLGDRPLVDVSEWEYVW